MLRAGREARAGQAGRAGGFTLVELLIAVFVALVVFVLGFTLLNGALQARSEAQRRIESSDTARLFFSLLERDLACALPGPWTVPLDRAALLPATTGYSLPAGQDLARDAGGQAYLLQLTTSNVDHCDPAARPQAVSSARYYVLKEAGRESGTLYRELSLAQPPGAFPFTTALAGQAADALFANVRLFKAGYVRWDESARSFVAAAAGQATHLDVALILLDPNEKLTQAQRERIFAKRIPLPAALP